MTRVQATAKCPSCKWKFFQIFEYNLSAIELIHKVNSEVDSKLLNHLKEHSTISEFLSFATVDQSVRKESSQKNFRGSFDLRYKELR